MMELNSESLRGRSAPSNHKGFTLIELLVVIAIIALLLSIIMPALSKVKESARRTICSTQQKDIAMTVRLYADDNRDWLPPFSSDNSNLLDENRDSRWFRIGGSAPDNYPIATWRNLGLVWRDGYWDEDFGRQLYCPAKNAAALNTADPDMYRYETYAAPTFATNYTSSTDGKDGVRVTYHFNPECKSTADRQRKYVRLSQGASNMVMLTDLITGTGVTHGKGWNVAKGDGSVSFQISQDALDIIEHADGGLDGNDYEKLDTIIRLLK